MLLKKLPGCLVLALLVGGVAGATEESPVDLPVSFGKVWYRPAIKSGFGSGKQSGFLTVTTDGIEFSSKKQSDFLPWSRVEMVSYGSMPGDLDTKWVVLGLEPVGGERHVAGLRDGSRMGYGTETIPIFDAVIEGIRRAEAGPYSVSEGHVPYITRFLQFALALPEGWRAFEVSNTLSGGEPVWGQTIFSPNNLRKLRADETGLKRALGAIFDGSAPAIQLDRFEAGEGFSCKVMKKAATRRLGDDIKMMLRPYRLTGEPQWSPQDHRGCTAWTATTTATKGETSVPLRFFTVSDGQTAYLFTVRGDAVEDARLDDLARSLRTMVAR